MTKTNGYLNEERLTAACILSFVGGFTDVYSYLCRGHVFANAVTGNMILLGLNVSQGAWATCGKYLLAIFAYGCGVFAADAIHAKVEHHRLMSWHQVVLSVEILLLSVAVFVPYGAADFVVDALIAFVCALQVQTFRRVRGLPFASTMCTGNLRSGSDALFNGLCGSDETGIHKARHYFVVIGMFILGAILGAILLQSLGPNSFILAPVALLIVFALLTGKRQLVRLRRVGRWFRGKRRKSRISVFFKEEYSPEELVTEDDETRYEPTVERTP